jgi:ATP-dependent Clp protease protease subunit
MPHFWRWVRDETGDKPAVGIPGEERTLYINGTISGEDGLLWYEDAVTAKAFKDDLAAGMGAITLWINSPGGDVFAASEIYTALKEYPGEITVKVDGLVASAASVIAMAGDRVLMSPTSALLVHNPSTFAAGDQREMEIAAQFLASVKETIITAYVLKTGMPRADLSALMDREAMMDATEAIALGFADGMLYAEQPAAANALLVTNSIAGLCQRSKTTLFADGRAISDGIAEGIVAASTCSVSHISSESLAAGIAAALHPTSPASPAGVPASALHHRLQLIRP